MKRQRQTKIVATLGPSSSEEKIIEKLFHNGVDVFRLNMSHGTHNDHEKNFHTIRNLEKKYHHPIGILADIQGPKLRVGTFAEKSVTLQQNQTFILDLKNIPGDNQRVSFPHPDIYPHIEKGTSLLIDDGKIKLKVVHTSSEKIETTVEVSGDISDRKGVNVPDKVLPISILTEKDLADLEFCLQLGVDIIALSFVQTADDIITAKKIIRNKAKVIAKLEKPSAIRAAKNIIPLCDGIMLARGDLGVEMPLEEVPAIQKNMVKTCRKLGKPIIIATQMLESMIQNTTPTRAEASDVASAVFEFADAVMLSGETAAGRYPLEAVSYMDKILKATEKSAHIEMLSYNISHQPTGSDAISVAAAQIACTINAKAIVSFTTSGSTALRAARERPPVPILGLTSNKETARYLSLIWGVHAVFTADVTNFHNMVNKACSIAKKQSFCSTNDTIVITAGMPFGTPGSTNVIRIAQT